MGLSMMVREDVVAGLPHPEDEKVEVQFESHVAFEFAVPTAHDLLLPQRSISSLSLFWFVICSLQPFSYDPAVSVLRYCAMTVAEGRYSEAHGCSLVLGRSPK
jgi:hypothetical protein